jgi:hypothetical protein
MPSSSWTVEIAGKTHTVAYDSGGIMASRVLVDGKVVLDGKSTRRSFFDLDSDFEFKIGNTPCVIAIRTIGFTYGIDLAVKGLSVKTGKPLSPANPMPVWGWIMAIASAFIALISTSTLIPLIAGATAAFGCMLLAREKRLPWVARIALCTLLTLTAWVIYLLIDRPIPLPW